MLVAVEAAGVGPWDQPLNGAGWDVGLRPPAALGVEGAGKVLAVGAGVTGFAVGDRVLAHEAPLPGGCCPLLPLPPPRQGHNARLSRICSLRLQSCP
ncbi:alcohol dehydrogenase catalytic domain-containing protein [Streptomyces mirabilis]|uniref:alcohol dehydrogenase catalytic domain-containing protein n=1 Tax=Streptomyces mirabilis TaxID=68239 RepID=UPI00363606E8